MDSVKVEEICTNISSLLKTTIKKKILKLTNQVNDYSFGQALIFFLADWLSGLKMIKSDQLQLLLEDFVPQIINFGSRLELCWPENNPKSIQDALTLPTCKLGFLDRHMACMDGVSFFLNLTDGAHIPAADRLPLEIISYNLTTLFVRYHTQYNSIKTKKGS